MILGNLGIVARNQGDLAAARNYFEQAVSCYRELGDQQSEGLALANLGLLFHYLGNDEAAVTTCYQALKISQSIGGRDTEAEVLGYLGHAQLSLGQDGEAAVSYQAALNIRQELGQLNMAIEPLAGLAAVALARQELEQSLIYIEEILVYLTGNSLDGTDEPFRVYLTCYQVLKANGDDRARRILETVYQDLQEQAANINSETMQQAFLNDIVIHRDIILAWGQVS
jgi:tetratricopeptide (TPR) repeat protein